MTEVLLPIQSAHVGKSITTVGGISIIFSIQGYRVAQITKAIRVSGAPAEDERRSERQCDPKPVVHILLRFKELCKS